MFLERCPVSDRAPYVITRRTAPAVFRAGFAAARVTLVGALLCGVALAALAGSPVPRTRIIYGPPGVYCAWPSVVRAANGDLLVAFTATEEHLGPDGRILCMRSTDEGATWGCPDTLLNTPIDDRESGFTQGGDGVVVVHLWSTFHTPLMYTALRPGSYPPEVLTRWSAAVQLPRYLKAAGMQGAWQRVSTDHGHTWSLPTRGRDAVHGGIALRDGSMLIASYRFDLPVIGVHRWMAGDTSFTLLATIGSPQPDSIAFGEPHLALLPSGRIIMMLRATTIPYDDTDRRCVLWETYSDDGGHHWALPFATPLWGFPPHLLVLGDGRVLCSYGYRRLPFGERCCVSDDGITWTKENEIVLRDDAPNADLGYPASVEIGGGRVLTVYYQAPVPRGTKQEMHPPDPGRVKPAIMGTVWTVPARSFRR